MFKTEDENRREQERKIMEENLRRQIFLRDKKLKAKVLDINEEQYGKIASDEIKSILIQYGSPKLEIDDYIIIQRQNSPKLYFRVADTKVFYTKKQALQQLYSWFNYYIKCIKRDLGMIRKELKREIDMIMNGGSMLYVRFSKECIYN